MQAICSKKLNELGDELIKEILGRKDFFDGFTVVVPSVRTEQWLKAYWLKTQNEILMNVSFRLVDRALLELIETDRPYDLISRDMLKLLIIKHLSLKDVASIPEEINSYVFGCDGNADAIKMHDIAEKLSQLYIEYDIECFSCVGWEKELYDLAMNDAADMGLGTLRSIFERFGNTKTQPGTLHFFGFSGFTAIQEAIIENYSKKSGVQEYMLEKATDIKDSPVIAASSKLREMEAVHGKICSLLEDSRKDSSGKKIPDNTFSSFLVLAPDISTYEPVISRVFDQDGKDFPKIPYAINDRRRVGTDVLQGLRKLVDISNKGFFTRLDFTNLINNRTIQKARGISPEDVEYWTDAVLKMNVFRNGNGGEDWDYARKRLLLSKVSSINDTGENSVVLSGEEYLPFSSIGFEDNSLVRLVSVIDDLKSWKESVKPLKTVNTIGLHTIRSELDKWFSIKNADDEETNFRYKKLTDIFSFWERSGMPEDLVPTSTFFFVLFDAGTVNHSANGEFFTKGVTFASFEENAIISADHIFFLGMGSREFPRPYVKSELDQRVDPAKDKYNRIAERFVLQRQNCDDFTASYITRNLKTDEQFFPSQLITWWDEKLEERIGIDEDRDWNSLFTRKEYKNKEYRISLLPKTSHVLAIGRGPANARGKKGIRREWAKTISTKDMSRFLDEPLKFKASRMFGWHDNSDEEIRDQYEPFEIDNLTSARLLKQMLLDTYQAKNAGAPQKDFRKESVMKRDLPVISDHFTDKAYKEISRQFDEIKKCVGDVFDLVSLEEMKLVCKEQSCMLVCSEKVFRYIDGNTRKYVSLSALRDIAGPTYPRDYTYLYVTSLMDIAQLDNGTEWDVRMIRGGNGSGPDGTYSVTPEKARDILTGICIKMNEGKTGFMPVGYLFDGKERNPETLKDDASGDDRSWTYFDDGAMFDKETQLGYSRILFRQQYKKALASMKKLVIFS